MEQTKYNTTKSYFRSSRSKIDEIKSMVLAIEYLKAAEQHCLLKTKERCCSLLIYCCYGEPFESREYRSLSPTIQLRILKTKLQLLKVSNDSIKSIIKYWEKNYFWSFYWKRVNTVAPTSLIETAIDKLYLGFEWWLPHSRPRGSLRLKPRKVENDGFPSSKLMLNEQNTCSKLKHVHNKRLHCL